MTRISPLQKSIFVIVASLFVIQVVVFTGILAIYRITLEELWLFAAVAAAYHAGLCVFLLSRGRDFRIEGTQDQLKKVNLANTLTIIRLSSIPSALFLILLSRRVQLLPVALPYLAIVFITDFFDGIAARRRNEITMVGKYLDSASDYLIIIATSIVFYSFSLIPLWFFILILSRLVIFAVLMGVAAIAQGKASPLSTFFGKASIFAVMVLYVLEVAEYFHIPGIGHPIVVKVFEYLAAAVIAVSFVDKAVFLVKLFRGDVGAEADDGSAEVGGSRVPASGGRAGGATSNSLKRKKKAAGTR
jgi:phosphatidylglycerophosphate synthase